MIHRIIGLTMLAMAAGIASAGFTPGNLVIAEAGDGLPVTETGAMEVTLREFTTGGVPTGYSVPLGNVGGRHITVNRDETGEAMLSRTQDGKFLLIGGYDFLSRAAGWDKVLTPRNAAKIDANGNVTFSFSFVPQSSINTGLGDALRHVVSLDGNYFIATGGDQGLTYGTFAGPVEQVFGGQVSSRSVAASNGEWIWNGSNAAGGSNGVVHWNGLSSLLDILYATPAGGSSRQIIMIDPNTMYLCCSSSGVGLLKMAKDTGGNWVELYRLGGAGIANIVRHPDGRIYACSSTLATSSLRWTVDTGSGFAPWTVIATAPANNFFKGIELSPTRITPLTVTGTVDLGQTSYFSGKLPFILGVSWRDASNNEIVTSSAAYDPITGAFSAVIPAAVVGPYRVSFKLDPWLRKTLPNPNDPAHALSSWNFGTVAPITGDIDADNDITNSDYAIWASNNGAGGDRYAGDLDGDGDITNSDYALWAAGNGNTGDN